MGKVDGVLARTGLFVSQRSVSSRRKPFTRPCSDNWCDPSHPTCFSHHPPAEATHIGVLSSTKKLYRAEKAPSFSVITFARPCYLTLTVRNAKATVHSRRLTSLPLARIEYQLTYPSCVQPPIWI